MDMSSIVNYVFLCAHCDKWMNYQTKWQERIYAGQCKVQKTLQPYQSLS